VYVATIPIMERDASQVMAHECQKSVKTEHGKVKGIG
jgi:hypothetical protein